MEKLIHPISSHPSCTHLTSVLPHYGKQWDGMPVLAMTHELTLERKSASYDLATTEWREPEGGEKQRGNEFEERKRLINEGVEMALCSRLCIFHLWSRHLCSFSHLCLMLSQTSPSKQLQFVCLSLCFCSTLSLILFPPFLYHPQKQNRQISHLSLV